MPIINIEDDLSTLFNDRFTRSSGVCLEHGTDISHFDPAPPEAVVFPQTVEEVQKVIELCAASKTPVIPYGAGTSVEGNIHAVEGGVCVDMSLMNQVIKVNEEDLDVVVQPGVKREQLNQYLRHSGLFFPIDPGANATLGGMASTRASGTNAVRYGTMKDSVLSLEVITATGEKIRTGTRAKKSAAGYDLTRLFIGSEGTLGLVTELTLKLHGIPEKIVSAVCVFPSIESAISSVIQCIQLGIPLARIEFVDEDAIKAVNQSSKLGLAEKPTLFLEFHGSELSVKEQIEITKSIMVDNDGSDFQWAERPEDRTVLWKARHEAALSVSAYATGTVQWWTDVCVPISSLAECIVKTKEDAKSSGLYAPILGHVGDGNFHVGICAREGNQDELAVARELHDRMVARALSLDGTCTGEHGIGLGKKQYLIDELGAATSTMKSIKQALDPAGIMNPGKIFI